MPRTPSDYALTPGVMLVPNGDTCVVVGYGMWNRPFATIVPAFMLDMLIDKMKQAT